MNIILILGFLTALALTAKPNTIGTEFLDDPGEVLFEHTEPITQHDFGPQRVAVVISGQTSRCLVGNYLKKYLIDPNKDYQFDIFVDLTDSAVMASGQKSKGSEDIKKQFADLPTKSIVIRSKPTLPTYGDTGSYKFPNRYKEWYEKDRQELYRANLQAMYTKYRLKQTVLDVEKENNVKYHMYAWFRDDQVFSNYLDISLVDKALNDFSIISKDCMQWKGMNEKLFFMKKEVFPHWGDFIRNFYEKNFPIGTEPIDGCHNSEQCHKLYFERLKVEIKRLGMYNLPVCDGIVKDGKVCFRNTYCESCSVPFEEQLEKVPFCEPIKDIEKDLRRKLKMWIIIAISFISLFGFLLLGAGIWQICKRCRK